MSLFEKIKNRRNLTEKTSGKSNSDKNPFNKIVKIGDRKPPSNVNIDAVTNKRGADPLQPFDYKDDEIDYKSPQELEKEKASKKPKRVSKKNRVSPGQMSFDLDDPKKTVKQSEISIKQQKFTDKVNKRRLERQSRKAERVKGATGGKTTGSLSKGNLSFPGDKSGAYQAAKVDLEVRKGLKKAGASSDFSPTMPTELKKVAQAKRTTRAIKQGTPDPFSIPSSKKPIRQIYPNYPYPFGDKPVTTGIDKPVTPKTFKNFRQDTGFNAKKTAIKDIRASEKRLYDAGVGKKPSMVQQRKFARDIFRKAQQKQTAEFNKQQRLYRQYDAYDDGDLGNPEFTKKTPKKVKFSSGARGKFASGSPEMGGESKKFAGRNRTPAPQVTKPVVSKTPPKVDPKFAKDAINPQVVTKTPFDAKSTTRPKVTSNVTYTDKPISKKVTNSKGIGNRFRGPENLAAKNAEIKKLKDAIKKNQSQAKVTSSADRGIKDALRTKGFYQYKIPYGNVDKKPPKTTKLGKFQKAIKKSKLGRFGLKALKNPYALGAAAVVGTGLGAYALLKNRGKNANAAKPLKSDDLATSGVAIRSTKTNKPIEMPLGKKFYTSRKDGVEPIGKNTYVPNEKKYQAQLRNNKK